MVVAVAVSVVLVSPLFPLPLSFLPQRPLYLLLLLVDQEALHGVVVVVFRYELRELALLFEHRASDLFLLLLLILVAVAARVFGAPLGHPLAPRDVLPADEELVRVLVALSEPVRVNHEMSTRDIDSRCGAAMHADASKVSPLFPARRRAIQ